MKTMKTLVSALALGLLAACGGGGCNPCEAEPTASTQPVNCAASGVCK